MLKCLGSAGTILILNTYEHQNKGRTDRIRANGKILFREYARKELEGDQGEIRRTASLREDPLGLELRDWRDDWRGRRGSLLRESRRAGGTGADIDGLVRSRDIAG